MLYCVMLERSRRSSETKKVEKKKEEERNVSWVLPVIILGMHVYVYMCQLTGSGGWNGKGMSCYTTHG